MKTVKILSALLAGVVIVLMTLLYPVFKILLTLWVVIYLSYMVYKYKNWTFAIPPVGGAMNLLAMLSNGGKMPLLGSPIDPSHVAITSATHFKFLCDILPLFHLGLFSFGDVVIAVIFPLTVLGYVWYRNYRKVKQ